MHSSLSSTGTHTYSFIVYLKFTLTWITCILSGNSRGRNSQQGNKWCNNEHVINVENEVPSCWGPSEKPCRIPLRTELHLEHCPWTPVQLLLWSVPRAALTLWPFCVALACGWTSFQAWRKPSSRKAERNMHWTWELVQGISETPPQMQGTFRGEPWGQGKDINRVNYEFVFSWPFALLPCSQTSVVVTKLRCSRKRVASPFFPCIEISRHAGLLHRPWETGQCVHSWDLCSLLTCWQFIVLG